MESGSDSLLARSVESSSFGSGIMKNFISYPVNRIDPGSLCCKEAGITVADAVFIRYKSEMKIVILCRITCIAIFQVRKLGDLFEFAFVPVVNQENIITVLGGQYGFAGGCGS